MDVGVGVGVMVGVGVIVGVAEGVVVSAGPNDPSRSRLPPEFTAKADTVMSPCSSATTVPLCTIAESDRRSFSQA